MARPLTTQSHTQSLTPPLEDYVTLSQSFQHQHVPVDSVITCLIYLQHVLIYTALCR